MAPLSKPRGATRRARPPAGAGVDALPTTQRRTAVTAWVALALLAGVLALRWGDALQAAFINDDFLFLDKTRDASFLSLFAPRDLAFHWYRPLSRELHYWTLQRLFGPVEAPFHLANFALWLGVMALYFALARRAAGVAAAGIATAGVAALAAWGVPLVWIAGVQDLWMLLFSLLALHAVARGRTGLATLGFVAALLSKETAAALPAVALAWERLIARRSWADTARRVAPLALVVVLWAAWHPMLGGRLQRPIAAAQPGLVAPAATVMARTVLMPFNLDERPAPDGGWARPLAAGIAPALLLVALVAWTSRAAGGERGARAPRGRVIGFGLAWAAAAWIPLALPIVGWHAYYAMLGALGAWLALGAALARFPAGAAALVGVLALLPPVRAATPSFDWGSEWYQRRADAFLRVMRANLRAKVPAPPRHSRFHFVMVPSNVGFLFGDGPALRVWYRDSTLTGGYYASYRPRAAGEPSGADYFFRFDSTAGWVPVIAGGEDVAAAQAANPRWRMDHEFLGRTFGDAGDWPRAVVEFEKVANAFPENGDHAWNAGLAREALGDSAAAAAWYDRAARLPGADDEVRAAAARLRPYLRSRAQPAR